MDVPYSIDVLQEDESQKAIITGELIINHIDNISEELNNSIDFSKNLKLEVTNPSSIDSTFVQIIFALKKSIETSGNTFEFEGKLNEEVYGLIANAGFNDLFKL